MKPRDRRTTSNPSFPFNKRQISTLMLSALLAACGGGGGGGESAANPPASTDTGAGTPVGTGGGTNTPPGTGAGMGTGTGTPAPTPGSGTPGTGSSQTGFTVQADREEAVPGGTPVTLTANAAASSTIQWVLAPGSAGSLSANTGNSVQYFPPPAGTAVANKQVNIIATNGDVNMTVIIVLGTVTANNGTTGATGAVPPAQNPSDDGTPATPESGIYLLAGNDFGAGMADGNGTAARFDTPTGIARDAQGNLYVADRFNNAIRKITPDGVVTTFAGMPGERGSADGAGSAARFSTPSGIAVDSNGNVYVADHGNANIRRITPGGTVTTLAGRTGLSGSADGKGSEAMFGGMPMALAVDTAGNVYVTERTTIRKITPDGTVSTIAGKSAVLGAQDGPVASASFNALKGITVDAAGNLYVVDSGLERAGGMLSNTYFSSSSIRRIGRDGMVTTLAGVNGGGSTEGIFGYADGPRAQARFNYPEGISVDGDGNLFVSDRGNNAVRRVAPDGTVTTIAGVAGQPGSADGSVNAARFMWPTAIVAAADAVFITDSSHHTVRRIVPGVSVSTIAGAAPLAGNSDGTRGEARFNQPLGVARDAAGNVYVADTGNETIRRITNAGVVTTFAGTAGSAGFANGSGAAARFSLPRDVTTDALGNIFVADFTNRLVRRITPAGEVSTYAGVPGASGYQNGPAATAQFIEPQAVATDASGNVFVADRTGDSIRLITRQGIVSTFAGDPSANGTADGTGSAARFNFPQDVVTDSAGNLYVIDSGSSIRKITPQGVVTTFAGAPFQHSTLDGLGTAARFNQPQSLAVDADGNVYVAESRAIRRISPQGQVTTIAGAAMGERFRNIWRPSGLAVSAARTLIYTSGNGVFELRLP